MRYVRVNYHGREILGSEDSVEYEVGDALIRDGLNDDRLYFILEDVSEDYDYEDGEGCNTEWLV